MKIYCAGPMHDRDYVRDVRDRLVAAGFAVTADWIDVEVASDDPDYKQKMAALDFKQCSEADVLVYCNTGYKSEGKATELGIALALRKPIVIVGNGGRSNNIFLNLGQPCFQHIEGVIDWLMRLRTKTVSV